MLSREFGLPTPEILESWIHAFANLRNLCAHHSRVWNRRFTIKPKIPYNTRFPFLKNINLHDNKLYAQLCCINYILSIISPNNSFTEKLKELILTCHLVDLKEMGFPANWEKEELWN